LLDGLGARFDPGKGCSVAPSAGTLRRVLIAIDAPIRKVTGHMLDTVELGLLIGVM
jgi:hypothetical protein